MLVRWLQILVLMVTFTRHSNSELFKYKEAGKKCREDIATLVREFWNNQLWALQMVDSSAKLPSGVLQGNIKVLGHYDECVEVVSSEATSFTGQYCLASVHLNPLAGAKQQVTTLLDVATLGRRDREITVNRTSVMPVPDLLPSLSLVQLGVCVPSSCSPRDVEVALSEGLQGLARSMGLTVSIEVPSGACNVKSNPPFDIVDKAMLFTVSVLGILVLAGTAVDLLRDGQRCQDWRERILLSFSIPANWSRLVRPVPNGTFSSLDGLRALSTLWIIVGHMVMYLTQEAITNKADMIKKSTNLSTMPWVNMPSVESFFLMSGMLRAFILLHKFDKYQFNFFKDACHRYLRLTPAYAMTVFFYATVLPRLGRGPYWNKVVERPANACRKLWPFNLIYLNNYSSSYNSKFCLIHSWYLASDMQLYLLAPLLLRPIWRRKRLAAPWLLGLCLVTSAIPFFYTLTNRSLTFPLLWACDMELKHYQVNVAITTHNRCSPYIVGLALGYLFYRLDNHRIYLTKGVVTSGWLLSMSLLCAVVFGPYEMVHYHHQYNTFHAALYGALHRPAWALAVAWIILACHTGYGGWVNSFLSARVFQPLSRLSYSVYLTHFAVLKVAVGRAKNERYFDEYDMLRRVAGETFVCLVSSLLLHLLVEAPGLQLTELARHQENSDRHETASSDNTKEKMTSKKIL